MQALRPKSTPPSSASSSSDSDSDSKSEESWPGGVITGMHGVKIEEVRYGPSVGNRNTAHAAKTFGEEPVAAGGRLLNAEDVECLESLAARKQAWAVSGSATETEPAAAQTRGHRPQTGRGEENNSAQTAETEMQQPTNDASSRKSSNNNDASGGAAPSVSMAERYAEAEAAVAEAEAAQKKAADHERTLKAKEARLMKMKVRS